MKVVVTGGSGFIGSNLAGELAKSHDVTVIDNLSTGRIENLDCIRDRVELIQGSILDLLSGRLPGLTGSFTSRPLHRCRGRWTVPSTSSEANVEGTLRVACGRQSLRNLEGGLRIVIVGLRRHSDSAQERGE